MATSGEPDDLDAVGLDDTETGGKSKFQVDMDLIPAAHLNDETDDLKGLNIDVFNQEDFEQGKLIRLL